jgi:hypothetical protein
MTTVLVVNHDLDVADQQTDSLRRLGYDVLQCAGPTYGPCPVMAGRPCEWVERADVLLYDVWATGEPGGARELIEQLRELHPQVPIVLGAPGLELSWVETKGRHRITPLIGRANGVQLAAAVEAALAY